MAAPTISLTQRYALKLMRDHPDNVQYGWGSSCTNPTMSALARKGLTRCEFDRSKGIAGFPWSRWHLTDEGRAVAETL